MANNTTEKKVSTETTPDYKKLYLAEQDKNKSLEVKIAELEKLCRSFSEKAHNAQEALQSATLEYNAKVEYMLDCVKHAHISIQIAHSASTKKGGNV